MATKTDRIGSIGDHPVHRMTIAATIVITKPRRSPRTCSQAVGERAKRVRPWRRQRLRSNRESRTVQAQREPARCTSVLANELKPFV